jgi:3-hydroxyisobutyrate dehydrogenase-like beta-hydroxyacid dehydrogenase
MTDRKAPIGFLGFGEAGFHLARGLRGAGAPPLMAFDISAADGAVGERIRARAAETGTSLAPNPAALADGASVILSVVTAASAVDAARSVAAELAPDHLFADLNSVAPATKRQISEVIATGPGRFVEGAILAPVPGANHRVPIVLNGSSAAALAAAVSPYHMRIDVMDRPVGAAAAVKMCRSIVIKGLEALLLECTAAANEYDAADRVFASLSETYPGIDWRKTASYMIGRVLEHGERRAREMEEVAHTLRAAGIDPLMAEATARRQDWAATLQRRGQLTDARPATADALLSLLVDHRETSVS